MAKTTKIFFDTEFTGLHNGTTLISIGLVSDTDKSFYAELIDYDKSQVDEWIEKNVMSNLLYSKYDNFVKISKDEVRMKWTKKKLKEELLTWLSGFDKIEMWSDCLSYDWVLFNDIFGDAFSIPKNIYYIPFDICTLMKASGVDPDISREKYVSGTAFYRKNKEMKHNSLYDAYIIREVYHKILFFG